MKRTINIFDKIGTLIPGYKGYKERDSRRECDRQLRQQITENLSEIENKVTALIDSSELSEMVEIENNRKKINNLKDLIKYSPYGASSFFSDNNFGKDELDSIYQMDLSILEKIDGVMKKSFHTILNADLKYNIEEIEILIKNRNNYIKNK